MSGRRDKRLRLLSKQTGIPVSRLKREGRASTPGAAKVIERAVALLDRQESKMRTRMTLGRKLKGVNSRSDRRPTHTALNPRQQQPWQTSGKVRMPRLRGHGHRRPEQRKRSIGQAMRDVAVALPFIGRMMRRKNDA